MNLTIETINDVTIAVLPGEYLDASNCGGFKQSITDMIQGPSKLVLDLSAVQFVDSSGCGAILSCLRTIRGANGELKLCGVSRQVRALFELIRMHRLVDIFDTREEALASFQ